jgi:hypothetical protein
LPVLKKRNKKITRSIPIIIEQHKDFLYPIFAYIKRLHIGDDDLMFNMERVSAYKCISKMMWRGYKLHPHFFRHCRTSHFLLFQELSEANVEKTMAWFKIPETYRHIGIQDVAKDMVARYEADKRITLELAAKKVEDAKVAENATKAEPVVESVKCETKSESGGENIVPQSSPSAPQP